MLLRTPTQVKVVVNWGFTTEDDASDVLSLRDKSPKAGWRHRKWQTSM